MSTAAVRQCGDVEAARTTECGRLTVPTVPYRSTPCSPLEIRRDPNDVDRPDWWMATTGMTVHLVGDLGALPDVRAVTLRGLATGCECGGSQLLEVGWKLVGRITPGSYQTHGVPPGCGIWRLSMSSHPDRRGVGKKYLSISVPLRFVSWRGCIEHL